MPMDRSRYPAAWAQISLAVREAAGWRCEWCGAPNGALVCRAPGGFWAQEPGQWHDRQGQGVSVYAVTGEAEYEDTTLHPAGCRLWNTRVVLTTAHLGPNKHDKMDCSTLAALCQSCHLREDAEERAARRRRTLAEKRARVQPALELEFAG